MKRLSLIIAGMISGMLVSYGAARLIGILFGPLYQSEDDMTRNVIIFLVASLVLAVIGGLIGNETYNRRSNQTNLTFPRSYPPYPPPSETVL